MRSLVSLVLLILVLGVGVAGCTRTSDPVSGGSRNDAADDVWFDIQQHWLQTQYGPCLREAGLRMNCGSCPAIMLQAEFVTDAKGGLKSTRIIRENVCRGKASPALRECFLRFYRSNPFPKALRGKTLRARLGTGLAC